MSINLQLPFLKETLDQNTFRILYYRNKLYLVPVFLFFLAGILTFFIVMPQVQDYFMIKDEEKNVAEKIVVIKNNTQVLSSLKEEILDKNLQIAASALPVEKDFGGILRAIGLAATDANVTLGDFSFQVGSLSPGATKITNALPIEIKLNVNDGVEGSKRFLRALTNRLPLSEITSLQVNERLSVMTVIFYYKPISQLSFKPSEKLQTLSEAQAALLEELSFFQSQKSQGIGF